MTLLRKIMVMALLGALGAAAGALLGEALFLGDNPRQGPREICLLFDVSTSMREKVEVPGSPGRTTQLEALQDAASTFVDRQDFALDTMALTVFAWEAQVVTGLTRDAETLKSDIAGLTARGGTNLGLGLDWSRSVLEHEKGERWIVLFTDGKPETSSTHEKPEAAALTAAARARDSGIRIVAIGTGLADADLLAEVTGSPDNVIISDPQKLDDAFRFTEEVISRQMLASTGSAAGFERNVLLTGAWVALIAIGAALGMVMGHNRHLHRPLLNAKGVILVLFGGLFTGALAGTAGQTIFHVLSAMPDVQTIGRVVAWALLGGGAGYGMGFFIPNLCRKRAAAAGAAGGITAALVFLSVVPVIGDTFGRLLGAGILGLCTGLTTVLVEATHRRAWLLVRWSEKESSSLALGESPILVGSAAKAHVLLPEADSPVPVMASITLSNGVVHLEDGQSERSRNLSIGETLTYGRIRIEVHASTTGETPKPPDDGGQRQEQSTPDPVQAAGNREEKWYQGV